MLASPAAPTAPAAGLRDRLRRVTKATLAYYLSAVVIFVLAARYRYAWPGEPFFDADGWGYLWGGLQKLTGGRFEHIFAREYAYPVFLEVILFVFGSFKAITVIQHGIGLLGGVLLLGCCHLLREIARDRRQPPGWARAWSPCWVGLVLTALYILNFQTCFYEHSLRPEAVFPSAVLASMFLNLLVIAGQRIDPASRPWMLHAAAVGAALGVGLMLLRPSFRLSALVASIPFILLLLRRDYSLARRLTVLALVLLAGGLLWCPERRYSADDRSSTAYLGERLFTAHADLISRQLDADLAAGHAGPYPEPWLRELSAKVAASLAESRQPENRPVPSLGFKPDYLALAGNPLRGFFPDDPAGDQSISNFDRWCFTRTALHQPDAVARKVVVQIYNFYKLGVSFERPGAKRRKSSDRKNSVGLGYYYGDSAARLRAGPAYDAKITASTAATEYLNACQRLKRSKAEVSLLRPIQVVDKLCWIAHLLLAGLSLGLCVALFLWKREEWISLRTLAATQGLLFFYPFGACLVTSVVFYVQTRYVQTLDGPVLVSSYASGLFVWQGVRAWRQRFQPEAAAPANLC